ncbi:MAG: hypothetical protein Q8L68_04870 [Methylococcales bacterium]|nr:hypothetical protein [Methylococcales bacterium]
MLKSDWQIQVEHDVSRIMETLISQVTHNKVSVGYDIGLNKCSCYSDNGWTCFNCSNVVYDFITDMADLISAKIGEQK